jgi:transcriptional regulator with XRE-family HTH domain
MPLRLPALQPEAIRAFVGDISVAHVQHLGPLLRETPSLEALLARLRVVDTAQATPELHRTVRAALATLPTLGPCLRQARHAQHLSLQALAQRCTVQLGHPVTPQHLSNLEQGQRLPSLPLFHVLATVLPLDRAAPVATAAVSASRLEAQGARAPRRASQDMLAHVQDAAQHVTHAHQAYREALTAAHQAGYSFRQLAAVCGRSPSRIRQLVGPSPSAPAPPTSPV